MKMKLLFSLKNLIKHILLGQLLFIYLGCAFNNSKEDLIQKETRKAEEKNKILRETFDIVTGLYQGTLKLHNEERTVSLGIYTLDVIDGTNSAGGTIIKPVLKAVYRQLYPIDLPLVLDGSFTRETNDLVFLTTGNNASFDIVRSINSKFSDTKIQGIVKTSTGELGELDLTFVQKQVDVPTEGDEDNIISKIKEQYSLVTGTYEGTIHRPATNREPQREWKVELGLYIIDVFSGTTPNGTIKNKPVLKARFKQLSPVAPNVILDVRYSLITNELYLFTNESSNPNAPDGLRSLTATLIENNIKGTASKTSGLWGDLQLNFIKKEVDSPSSSEQEDYNQRLIEEFKTVVGNYEGKISPFGQDSFEFILNIYINSEVTPTGTVPKLKAYYCRKDDRFKATELFMNVQYKPELTPAGMELSGQRIVNGSMVYYVSLSGIFKNNSIEGNYINQTGKEGPFKLKRINNK